MLAAICAIPLAFLAEVELHGEVLRLGDVADLSPLPAALAGRVGGTPLLRVDRGVLHAAVPQHQLATAARARLPRLANCFAPTGDPVVIRRKVAAATPTVSATDPAGIARGQTVGVRIASGPFAIERSGIAQSEAQRGQRLFVRTASGQVIRAVVDGALR